MYNAQLVYIIDRDILHHNIAFVCIIGHLTPRTSYIPTTANDMKEHHVQRDSRE